MRNSILLSGILFAATVAHAQDTYMNDRLTSTDDLNGSARYVGMGGALGALGADLSVISDNPAGIGLYRKSDVGLSFGAVVPNGNGWNKNDPSTYGEGLARGSFDQMGFVFSMNTGGNRLKFFNLAVNYQKKKNFNQGFYADNNNLGGSSQLNQLTDLCNAGYDTDNNLAGLALDEGFLTDGDGNYVDFSGERNRFTRHSRGSLQGYDFNISFNLNDRVYLGLTASADNLKYRAWQEYYEENKYDGGTKTGDYSTYNDIEESGFGTNAKVGLIVRPIEENSFRIGVTAETPTWYRIKNSTLYSMNMYGYNDAGNQVLDYGTKTYESYIESTIRTPWKGRISMGSTVGTRFAWGLGYEYANYGKTKTGVPKWNDDEPGHSSLSGYTDFAMNQFTRNTLRGQHTLKAGIEYKPITCLALRAGYNYISSRFKDNANFDQYGISSSVMDYTTTTDFMTLSDAHIATIGLGYVHKKFYADFTYKFRAQSGDFYAFDATGQNAIDPVDVNLNRHQVIFGLGFKF